MSDSSDQPLDEYYAALRRLIAGAPLNVPRGSKITNDAVSLEAARGKGSIKKSRPIYADLIRAIQKAAKEEARPEYDQKTKLAKYKDLAAHYRTAYEAALARELSLLKELYEMKKQLTSLTGEKVVPLRKPRAKGQS